MNADAAGKIILIFYNPITFGAFVMKLPASFNIIPEIIRCLHSRHPRKPLAQVGTVAVNHLQQFFGMIRNHWFQPNGFMRGQYVKKIICRHSFFMDWQQRNGF
jgi:hypothetical protein